MTGERRRFRTTTVVAGAMAAGLGVWAVVVAAVWFGLSHPAANGWALVVLGLGAAGGGLWWVTRPVEQVDEDHRPLAWQAEDARPTRHGAR
ncbi:hypothetical protein KMZ30_07430 [Phycicoccus sp. KQZ13P-1]|uniref:hypothetical protein n=1 Tax=Phycicoccus mangrovi TaxID=2840470 RepID=UPI001C00149D|nr:hypothetical protein [Phycicoccus mangrovi]MBT9255403.1 hypothetical protein [Phycicoccus mangrovi]